MESGENTQNQNQPPAQTAPTAVDTAGDNRTLMGVLAYLGPLVIIPYIMAKNDTTVRFHVQQGFVLLTIEIAAWIISAMVWLLIPITMLINLAAIVLSVIGIINVLQGHQKELPVVGSFSKHFNTL